MVCKVVVYAIGRASFYFYFSKAGEGAAAVLPRCVCALCVCVCVCVCVYMHLGVCVCVCVCVHACVHTLKVAGSGFNSYCGGFMLEHECAQLMLRKAGNSDT